MTDVTVDRRKSKRLAHRIRAWARKHKAPRVVFTSPLQRAADAGRWLAAWGWSHHIDARLCELDFGQWDGQRWEVIGKAAVDEWTSAFGRFCPGGGESVQALLDRCGLFLLDAGDACVVTHAGWISALQWRAKSGGVLPTAAQWPASMKYSGHISVEGTALRASGRRERTLHRELEPLPTL